MAILNASNASQQGPSSSPTEDISQASWQASDERARYLKFRRMFFASLLILMVIIGGGLYKHHMDNFRAAERARWAESQASDLQQQTFTRVADAKADLDKADADVENAINPASLQGKISFLQTQLANARSDARAAADRYARVQQQALDAYKRRDNDAANWLLFVCGAFAASTLAWVITRNRQTELKRQFENRVLLSKLGSDVNETAARLDFAELWRSNKTQLSNYHQLVLNYAASTRQMTFAVLATGFGFLVAVSLFSLFAHSLAGAISASVVAAVGAAVTGFIANATLANSQNSSEEVLRFFAHPIDVERTLAAERLLRGMDPHMEARAKMTIIQGLMRMPTEGKNTPDNGG